MIDYTEDWIIMLLPMWRGSVGPRASLFAIPSSVLTMLLLYADDWMPTFRQDMGLTAVAQVSVLWAASTAMLVILLGFRTNRAMARFWEGTGLLHQMRGEWFDSVSCCVTFTNGAKKDKLAAVTEFRHTIVRLMSLCHGSALEEISFSDAEDLQTIDLLGLSTETLTHLQVCKQVHDFNRVEVILHLIQSLITQNHEDGVLKIPPPILSRVYQTLSRGFVNFLNAKKIADTRFPFPYAQTIASLLFMQMAVTPIMISCLTTSKFLGPLFTFIPIFGMFSLNFIGVELENPFGDDDNDLPLDHFQSEMNKCLLMLLQDDADLLAGTSEQRCVYDFTALAKTMTTQTDMKTVSGVNSHCRISELCIDLDLDNVERARQTAVNQGRFSKFAEAQSRSSRGFNQELKKGGPSRLESPMSSSDGSERSAAKSAAQSPDVAKAEQTANSANSACSEPRSEPRSFVSGARPKFSQPVSLQERQEDPEQGRPSTQERLEDAEQGRTIAVEQETPDGSNEVPSQAKLDAAVAFVSGTSPESKKRRTARASQGGQPDSGPTERSSGVAVREEEQRERKDDGFDSAERFAAALRELQGLAESLARDLGDSAKALQTLKNERGAMEKLFEAVKKPSKWSSSGSGSPARRAQARNSPSREASPQPPNATSLAFNAPFGTSQANAADSDARVLDPCIQ